MNASRLTPDRWRRGSALVLVFWCLLLLSLAVFAVVELVELSVDHASHEQLALEARTLAASGAAIAQAPQLLAGDPLLAQQVAPGREFHATIEKEGARLNLNYLLSTKHREVLTTLFLNWGVSRTDAEHAAACLEDWVSPGDLPSLNGAKDRDYAEAGLPQRPSHQLFQSWQEVMLVMGMDRIAEAKPDWQDELTLWSDGPLDVTVAPAERMEALFGVQHGRLDSLIELRNGRDGIAGTPDDQAISPATFQAAAGLTNDQMKTMQDQISFGSKVRRIHSVGRAGGVSAELSVVCRLEQNTPQYLVWSER